MLPFTSINTLASSTFEDAVEGWASQYAGIMGAENFSVDYSKLNIEIQKHYYNENDSRSTGKIITLSERQEPVENRKDFPFNYHSQSGVKGNIEYSWKVEKGIKKGTTKSLKVNLPVPYSTAAMEIGGEKSHEVFLNNANVQTTSREITNSSSADITLPAHTSVNLHTILEGDEYQTSLITPYLINGVVSIIMSPVPINGKLSKNYHYVTQQKRPIGLCRLTGDNVTISFGIGEVFYRGSFYLSDDNMSYIYPSVLTSNPHETQYYEHHNDQSITFYSVTKQTHVNNVRLRTILE